MIFRFAGQATCSTAAHSTAVHAGADMARATDGSVRCALVLWLATLSAVASGPATCFCAHATVALEQGVHEVRERLTVLRVGHRARGSSDAIPRREGAQLVDGGHGMLTL